MNYRNQIFNMDCLAGLSLLPDDSVDMVLTDLPYGTTSGAWDTLLPLRCVEEIAVFYRAAPTYNPQGLVALEHPRRNPGKHYTDESVYRKDGLSRTTWQRFTGYPRQILTFPCQREGLHPTQKPVALFEYLVLTYTDPGQLVLDCCMGSGTTKVACRNAVRDYVGFEIDRKYYEIAQAR